MKILIAEDDRVSRRMLKSLFERWGHETIIAEDGDSAWEIFQQIDDAVICVLDWTMPGSTGLELCGRMKNTKRPSPAYIILLTAMDDTENKVEGLDAGADDYVTKPFDPAELRARAAVGVRILNLQTALAEKVTSLTDALSKIKRLQGLLPICASCKNVRDDKGYWNQIDEYLNEHTDAEFSHSICPTCVKKLYPDYYHAVVKEPKGKGNPLVI